VMLGVRMSEGLPVQCLGQSAMARVGDLVGRGLVESERLASGRVVLTRAGRLLADAVVRELTP